MDLGCSSSHTMSSYCSRCELSPGQRSSCNPSHVVSLYVSRPKILWGVCCKEVVIVGLWEGGGYKGDEEDGWRVESFYFYIKVIPWSIREPGLVTAYRSPCGRRRKHRRTPINFDKQSMSKSTVRSLQTMKSLNRIYKVCNGTNTSRSYCIDSSFKALPFAKKNCTLNSDTIDEIFDPQNPNQFPRTGSGQDWSSRESHIEYSQHPNGFYRETSMGFHRSLSGCGAYGQSYYMGDHGLHCHNQYNVNGSYTAANFQISNRCYSGMDKKLEEAVEVLGLLELKKVTVEMPRYLFLMKACGESQALKEAKDVHNHLTRSGHYFDVHICNQILEMYSKCGSMEGAYKVFDKMPKRNLTSWDTMITGFAKNSHGEDAIKMFSEFKKIGLKPDNQMFHGVFVACSVLGDMKQGLLQLESMIKTYNLAPSMDDYFPVIDMLGSSGYLNEALEFVEKMPMKPSVEIWKIMMNQSRVHGDLELEDHCAEIVNLLDPSCLDKQLEKAFIPIKPANIAKQKEKGKNKSSTLNLLKIKTETFSFRAWDTSPPDHEKLYSQLRCLKQHMVEVGYVARTRLVLHDVDHESREEYLLSHSRMLALSEALLISPARAPIRIINNHRICANCHDAFKIISKLVGRSIVARDERRFHHF
ncbi:unnamed protein product [Lactuca saligna]|uniref:DYW domain-containing protein n=1 Tax=Lactuca saligna TaxID=75948 RepID=A0AA36A3D0_LACSI|nr:unnamed protein product [Lactuca saligna]